LFLLVVYSLDLAWKLANWNEAFGGVAWWGIALGLAVRFAFMGFVLFIYLRLRKALQEPTAVTRITTKAALRHMRIFHIAMLCAIVSYAFVAALLRPAAGESPLPVEGFWIVAALMVLIAYGFRRKLLPAATRTLLHEPGDAEALGRWRMTNILSMIFASSVSMYGVALRAIGGSGRVVWPFFIVSALLMLWWRPRLNDSVNDPVTSTPSLN